MQFTWSDYGDEKYFHIFDTETREMKPIHNPIECSKNYSMMIQKNHLKQF